MYTVDDEKEDLYETNDYETSSWDNNKGLIFKIIIIILCVIVLIWLIKALKSNRNLDNNNEVHMANVEKVRLAAEKYFFINNNKEKYNSVSLAGLKDAKLVDDIVDANNRVCNEHSTKVTLNDDTDSYKMVVMLSCSTNDSDEVYYYHKNTLACFNCNGRTYMTGNTVIAKDDENDGGNGNVSDDISNGDDEYRDYSCIDWTPWSKDRIYDSSLTERSKTLVQGVKYGTKTTYGDWSDYTTTPIVGNDNLEVESKTVGETVWSENKTGRDIDVNNSNIKVISKEVVNENINCENGYVLDNICYSNQTTIGNLTFKEYNSGNYKVKKEYCEGLKTLQNSDGLYVLTYVNCEYNEIVNKVNVSNEKYTLYTYQELETRNIVYYRSRTVNTVSEPDQYTQDKYEEENLPEGYVKVPGSEETYYSYKLNTCEK